MIFALISVSVKILCFEAWQLSKKSLPKIPIKKINHRFTQELRCVYFLFQKFESNQPAEFQSNDGVVKQFPMNKERRAHALNIPSSRLLPTKMSIPSKLASRSMVIGSAVINTPSIVGADGNPKMPEYEFHCWTEMVFASTFRMQCITEPGESWFPQQERKR